MSWAYYIADLLFGDEESREIYRNFTYLYYGVFYSGYKNKLKRKLKRRKI